MLALTDGKVRLVILDGLSALKILLAVWICHKLVKGDKQLSLVKDSDPTLSSNQLIDPAKLLS